MKELIEIQNELKAPKDKDNKFGNFSYRNAESILQELKPILKAHNCELTLTDDVVNIGERFYIKATARLRSEDDNISVTSFAREVDGRAGMDAAQVTGAASSYARKYALCGLFCIGSEKDPDELPPANIIAPHEADALKAMLTESGADVEGFMKYFRIREVDELPRSRYKEASEMLKKKIETRGGTNE